MILCECSNNNLESVGLLAHLKSQTEFIMSASKHSYFCLLAIFTIVAHNEKSRRYDKHEGRNRYFSSLH